MAVALFVKMYHSVGAACALFSRQFKQKRRSRAMSWVYRYTARHKLDAGGTKVLFDVSIISKSWMVERLSLLNFFFTNMILFLWQTSCGVYTCTLCSRIQIIINIFKRERRSSYLTTCHQISLHCCMPDVLYFFHLSTSQCRTQLHEVKSSLKPSSISQNIYTYRPRYTAYGQT